MKTQSTARKPAQTSNAAKVNFVPDASYTEVSSDIVGFWTQANVLHGVPLHIKLFDSEIEPTKPSILITVRLTEDLEVVKGAKDGHEEIVAKAGQTVGVWARPGLAALAKACNCDVYVVPDGEKDIGKPSMMKLFKVYAKGAQSRLPVDDDYREQSAKTKTRWLPNDYRATAPKKPRPEYSDTNGYDSGDEDDVDFDE